MHQKQCDVTHSVRMVSEHQWTCHTKVMLMLVMEQIVMIVIIEVQCHVLSSSNVLKSIVGGNTASAEAEWLQYETMHLLQLCHCL